MQPALCLYEDEATENFYPLILTRAVHELHCGMFSLGHKLIRHFPGYRVHYFVRHQLKPLLLAKHEESVVTIPAEDVVFLVSRLLLQQPIPESFESSTALICKGRVIGGYLKSADLRRLRFRDDGCLRSDSFTGLPEYEVEGEVLEYIWDVVHCNPRQIIEDFRFVARGGQIFGKLYPHVTMLAQENVCLGLDAKLYPGVVIDGESGPVYIAEGAKVLANAVIEGPAFIGRNSIIKIGAKIYGGTSIGEMCKVGGEVECSIIHGYSNKQHEGFLGHAYLGEWVNLGADTNNSDLKNNYKPVRVQLREQTIDSGHTFVGLFMGDHSKTGINTMFNTGTVVGVCCNVFGAGYPPKHIPSFQWGGAEGLKPYELEKALETARLVMARRQRKLSSEQEELLRLIHSAEKER